MPNAVFFAVMCVLLFCGCMSSQEKEPAHPASSNPLLTSCNNRTSVDGREACYLDVAVARTSPALCAEITLKEVRNRCYLRVSKGRGDPSLCLNIRDDDWLYTECMRGAGL